MAEPLAESERIALQQLIATLPQGPQRVALQAQLDARSGVGTPTPGPSPSPAPDDR